MRECFVTIFLYTVNVCFILNFIKGSKFHAKFKIAIDLCNSYC